ncbi:PAS domain S-box protein [Sphingosinicella sp. BN140058]|uniref:PAS domain S-box protein n=1 Tax=Sphingosinicella sp. BN140058 TaxID=1892855 RepID=UPI0013EBD8DC|nr:PAS domain S-box protein [Sphingosinicella sp. BN140058]
MTSSPVPPVSSAPLSFLSDGGEMGARMRGFDWAATPLGPPAAWPQALKTVVGLLLSTAFPMFVAWGPELRFLYNDGYVDILGGKHPDALGAPFEQVWAELWEDVGPIAARALAGDSSYHENLPLLMTRRGSPEQTWFTFSYSPIRDESGAVGGMFCTCVETTNMVLAERERVDEAERLRRLFDQAPGFMSVLRGPNHVYELINASFLQLVGHRDLVGKPVREALPEVEGQGFFELLDEVYRTGRAYAGRSMLIALQRAPGAPSEERLLDFVFAPIVDSSGKTTGIFAEGYDVTERHLAEQALRESEERFRLIADSAPVPMWVTKLDRSRGFVNAAYAGFLGVPYDEALHFDWRERIHPEDAARVVTESLAGEATLKPFELEARYLRADGAWRWLRSISQPRWGSHGEHVGFIGIATDITDAKQAEAALREVNETLERRVAERTADLSTALDRLQTEVGERIKAEDALRQAQKMEAVGQLTGGIAHDFNNLLTPIMGGLELIARRIEDPKLQRIAQGALESSRRGAKLTSQLLAFSRIQRISMAPVLVNDVIANMQTLLRHTIGSAVIIHTELDAGTGHALCDANQLENAVLNLAINARDAMPSGGALTIATARVSLDKDADHEAGDFVRIRVADTGQGMSAEVLARATEPFYSTKAVGKGTGLGLAQVYGIARQSGGTLRIDSAIGTGTRVDILLPAIAPPEAKAGERDTEQVPRRSARTARILLVDDDPDVRTFLAESLRGLDHDVRTADGGEAALAVLKEWRPEIALIDYAMPGMHGADVAAAARALIPNLPIVFVTGYAETDQLEAVLGPNAPVLRKPFTIAALANAVDDNLAPADPD